MQLTQAFDWIESIRPTWHPSADGYGTLKINQKHVLNAIGNLFLDQLTPMSFVEIQQYGLKQGKSPSTCNRITAVLSVVVNEAVKHHKLTAPIPFTQLKEPKGKQEFYTPDEVKQILMACKSLDNESDFFYDLFFLAAKTGARQGELLKMTWSCIDWDANTLTFFDTKNGDDRVLPMTMEIRGLLKRKWRNRIDDDRLFPIGKDKALRELRKIQKIAGLTNMNKNFHTFRHTAATHMFANGASLPEVKEVLGHRNERTTMRYSHATNEGKLRALATL